MESKISDLRGHSFLADTVNAISEASKFAYKPFRVT